MVIGIGTDIIEINRVKKACINKRFIEKVYTEKERLYLDSCKENKKRTAEKYAGNFAAKEAISKCLGIGFSGYGMNCIEVLRDDFGKPIVNFYGKAKERKDQIKASNTLVSISHCENYAVAYAIMEG